jgi:hypothetical protein
VLPVVAFLDGEIRGQILPPGAPACAPPSPARDAGVADAG